MTDISGVFNWLLWRNAIKMNKVLIFGPPPFGGISSVMQTILDSPLAKNYRFEVFERTYIPDDQSGFIKRNLFRISRFIRFFRKLRVESYDFVHFHTPLSSSFPGTLVFMIIARLAGVKILLHIHGTDWNTSYEERSEITKFLFRMGFRLPQHTIALYDTWQINILKLVPKARVHTIANCLEDSAPADSELAKKIKSKIGAGDDNFLVLTVGFVGARKGYLDILDAVPDLVRFNNSMRFVFVGGEEHPGENHPVFQRIKELNLARWVHVMGEVHRSEIPSYLAAADLFLLPSREEGMPIAILEAMRAGLPIVTTTVGGIPEMIEDGFSGILIEPGNPHEIAEAVTRLVKDENLRENLAEGARATFENKFETHVCISELGAIYTSMLDGR
jgi:glycosyltransferase involved in cell wall biosynthesis